MSKRVASFILFFLSACALSAGVSADDLESTVTLYDSTYTGFYQGETAGGVPEGTGTFTCSDEADGFVLTGTWELGQLTGTAEIQYGDGSVSEAEFADGLLHGSVTNHAPDGSSENYKCSKGRPYGRILKYDSDGQTAGYDFFYQMQPVQDLISRSVDADYNALLGNSYAYAPQKVRGRVSAVFESDASCYALLTDSESHPYVLEYNNTNANRFNRSIVPNLTPGDEITAYGYLYKKESLDSITELGYSALVTELPEEFFLSSAPLTGEAFEDLLRPAVRSLQQNAGNTCPFLLLFYAETAESRQFDFTAPSQEYEDVLANPCLCEGFKCTVQGTVEAEIVSDSDSTDIVTLLLSEEGTGHIYSVRCNTSQKKQFPGVGDSVSVSGSYSGNYKKECVAYDPDDPTGEELPFFITCPQLSTGKVSIL